MEPRFALRDVPRGRPTLSWLADAGGGPQKLVALGSEVGGGGDALRFVQDMLRTRVCRAQPTVRTATTSG